MVWKDVLGWFSDTDGDFVAGKCRLVHGGVVVEIGTYAGRATTLMAPICLANGGAYHAIDNFRGSRNEKDPATQGQQNDDILTKFEQNMRAFDLWGRIVLHISDSIRAATSFRDGSVDFCFIDGDHTPEGVSLDLETWWPKIKLGGMLAGHDYHKRGLRGAVVRFSNAHGQVVENGGVVTNGRRRWQHVCWAIRKR